MKKAVLRARYNDVKEYQENLKKVEIPVVKEEQPKKRGRKKND